jgi:hypothetical protein
MRVTMMMIVRRSAAVANAERVETEESAVAHLLFPLRAASS